MFARFRGKDHMIRRISVPEAQEIIVIGYSLPETDFFFRNLFALGTVGRKFIRRFAVVNPDWSGLTN
jgi:hypothetical protein